MLCQFCKANFPPGAGGEDRGLPTVAVASLVNDSLLIFWINKLYICTQASKHTSTLGVMANRAQMRKFYCNIKKYFLWQNYNWKDITELPLILPLFQWHSKHPKRCCSFTVRGLSFLNKNIFCFYQEINLAIWWNNLKLFFFILIWKHSCYYKFCISLKQTFCHNKILLLNLFLSLGS